MLALGLFLFWLRIDFILEHGGMEGPNGEGSPLAFLIGWVSHQVFVTVPSAALSLGLWSSWRRSKTIASSVEAAP